ncbi:hypothetical protein DRN46_05235 [Thermococci archaeon]|nr:MAG: hypothetical protein DRN46_05235 [Thermococci archaeon]
MKPLGRKWLVEFGLKIDEKRFKSRYWSTQYEKHYTSKTSEGLSPRFRLFINCEGIQCWTSKFGLEVPRKTVQTPRG